MFMEAEEGTRFFQPILSRFEEKIAQANMAEGREFPLAMSYGVVTVDASDGRTLDQVLAEADRLMYVAKQEKRAMGAA